MVCCTNKNKYILPSHLSPCLNNPYNSEPQWSQNVGDIKLYPLKRCGTSILNRSLKYYNITYK